MFISGLCLCLWLLSFSGTDAMGTNPIAWRARLPVRTGTPLKRRQLFSSSLTFPLMRLRSFIAKRSNPNLPYDEGGQEGGGEEELENGKLYTGDAMYKNNFQRWLPRFINQRFRHYDRCLDAEEMQVLTMVYTQLLDKVQSSQGDTLYFPGKVESEFQLESEPGPGLSQLTYPTARKRFEDYEKRSEGENGDKDLQSLSGVVNQNGSNGADSQLIGQLLQQQMKLNHQGPSTAYGNFKKYGTHTTACKRAFLQARLCSAG